VNYYVNYLFIGYLSGTLAKLARIGCCASGQITSIYLVVNASLAIGFKDNFLSLAKWTG
jgi:hypothetical protein